MKIDRLYAIMVHLLSHGRTSASELARRFEVSVRTIQRDVDTLCRAGIPVAAYPGAGGGYALAEGWRMDGQLASGEDRGRILTALEGLASATGDPRVLDTLEKVAALPGTADRMGIVLDFSVLREQDGDAMFTLQSAIRQGHAVRFDYTNADLERRAHTVEPVALLYRWYAWYLLAYSRRREDYRMYKLVRMENVVRTDEALTRRHAPAEDILRKIDGEDRRAYLEIEMRCTQAVRARAVEYLRGAVEETYEDGDVRMRLRVVENESLWIGFLLSLGGEAEVLSPDFVRQRLLGVAKEIVERYDQP